MQDFFIIFIKEVKSIRKLPIRLPVLKNIMQLFDI